MTDAIAYQFQKVFMLWDSICQSLASFLFLQSLEVSANLGIYKCGKANFRELRCGYGPQTSHVLVPITVGLTELAKEEDHAASDDARSQKEFSGLGAEGGES